MLAGKILYCHNDRIFLILGGDQYVCLGTRFRLLDQVGDQVLWVGLFSAIDDIFREGESAHTRPAHYTVVAGGSVGHLHCRELEEALAEGDSTQQELSVTAVAAPVLVLRTASASSDPVHVLVTLARVLSEVDSGTEHPANVGVPLIESFLCNRLYEGRPVEQHPLVGLVVVLLGHLPPPVTVPLPQLRVPNFLYFEDPVV
jgi:hypothetical protein